MREAFETAPRDGKVVILEDDASGTYEALAGRLRPVNGSEKMASQ